MTDFTFAQYGDGIVALYPENNEATKALNEFMKENDGSNKIFFLHWPALRKHLKSLGWKIRKAKPLPKLTDNEIDELLTELGE